MCCVRSVPLIWDLVCRSHTHTAAETDAASPYLFALMLLVMALAQAGLYLWKKKHARSFNNVTLVGLWIIPFGW